MPGSLTGARNSCCLSTQRVHELEIRHFHRGISTHCSLCTSHHLSCSAVHGWVSSSFSVVSDDISLSSFDGNTSHFFNNTSTDKLLDIDACKEYQADY